MTGQILFVPSAVMIVASLIAAPIGAMMGKKMDTKILQWILSVLIFASAIKIWLEFI